MYTFNPATQGCVIAGDGGARVAVLMTAYCSPDCPGDVARKANVLLTIVDPQAPTVFRRPVPMVAGAEYDLAWDGDEHVKTTGRPIKMRLALRE